MTKNLSVLIIAILFVHTQMYSQTKSKITFGGNATYHIDTSAQQKDNCPFLFFKNGQSAGLDLTLVPPKGTTRYKLTADYIMGTNDENAVMAYAKAIEYSGYRFTISKPKGLNMMVSPQLMLLPKSQNKKLPLMWLDLKVGALFSNQQTLQFFNGQSVRIKEIKSNAVSFVFSPSLVVNVVKTKKLFLNLRAGYSNFGGFGFGLSIAESDCRGAPCCKCGWGGCNPCATESNNLLNN